MTNVHPLHSGATIPAREDRDWVTSAELQADAGITYRQLDYWCRTDLLRPLEAPNPGSGYLRRFDNRQIDRARALHDLLAAGISLPICRQIIDDFVATGRATTGHLTISRTPGDAA